VAAFRNFDPSSMDKGWREIGQDYLISRVDITKALRADIMAGPIILPYNIFPTTEKNQPIWSDDLQDWLVPRYQHAQRVLDILGNYAASQGVKVAIEPVDHWETPAPNLVRDVARFIRKVNSPFVGVCIDSAHVVLGSDGPKIFVPEVEQILAGRRLHYVHISAPDRGAVHDSWIPWASFLRPILNGYDGPFLVEVFNAIPVFLNSLRITRRKFRIPGEDTPDQHHPDAYTIAREAILKVRQELSEIGRL
jgi:sugar phosphate isomerase/epimerase